MRGATALVPVGGSVPAKPAVTRLWRWAMRLSDAFESFLAHMQYERQCAPHTIVAYRTAFLQYLGWLERTMALERAQGVKPPKMRPNDLLHFTTDRIRQWQHSLALERHLTPSTVRKNLAIFNSFARYLMQTGAIGENPMLAVVAPKKRVRRRTGVPPDGWQKILELPGLSSRDQAIRAVLAWAGLRREEVRTLRVESLRLANVPPCLLVRGKGDKERLIEIPECLRAVLFDYTTRLGLIEPTRFLFTTETGELLHPSTLTKMVRTWGERAQLPYLVSPHRLRHTYATGLGMAGVPPHIIQAQMGHSSLATTSLYLHGVSTPQVSAAIGRFAGGSATQPPASESQP